jgi:hypothetical protein
MAARISFTWAWTHTRAPNAAGRANIDHLGLKDYIYDLEVVALGHRWGSHPIDRFEQKFIPEPNSGCWLWIAHVGGPQNSRPYAWNGEGQEHASRVSWKFYRGPIPDGLHVLHRCDIPLCVNPDHLFLGTHADNMQDMRAKGRAWKGGAPKLTVRDVWEIRQLIGYFSNIELGEIYGIDKSQISRIKTGDSW